MHVSLLSLLLPIGLSAVALFFTSFVSWMVLQLHKHDWKKLPDEDKFLAGVNGCPLPEGSYMFPGAQNPAEMNSDEYKRKYEAGPRGIMTILPRVNMGKNLAITFVLYLVVSTLVGYLASLALHPGAEFRHVFRFVSTTAVVTFLTAIVQHAIWFRPRIVGHVIETVLFAIVMGSIFGALWPKA
jgi:hypothetical protein